MLKHKFYVTKIEDLKIIFHNKKIMKLNKKNSEFTKQYLNKIIKLLNSNI